MYVRNRMTVKPYTVIPDTTVADALELMRTKNIRRVPVVNGNMLVGIITERKLLEVSPSSATTLSIFEINYLLSKTKVESVMTKNVVTVTPGTLLEEAALKMRDHDVGGLPVVDEGKLVGIITETDIFDSFIEIMGFRDQGSRIAIEIEDDKPGLLAHVASILAEQGINISHIAIYRDELIVRINVLNIHDVVETLNQNGYKVISILKNE